MVFFVVFCKTQLTLTHVQYILNFGVLNLNVIACSSIYVSCSGERHNSNPLLVVKVELQINVLLKMIKNIPYYKWSPLIKNVKEPAQSRALYYWVYCIIVLLLCAMCYFWSSSDMYWSLKSESTKLSNKCNDIKKIFSLKYSVVEVLTCILYWYNVLRKLSDIPTTGQLLEDV